MDDLVGCLQQVGVVISAENLRAGNLLHAFEQLSLAVRADQANASFAIEQQVKSLAGVREIDIIIQRAGEELVRHIEIKTGTELRTALDEVQLTKDAFIAATKGVQNEWVLAGANFEAQGVEAERIIRQRLESVRKQLEAGPFTDAEVKQALGSFHFVDMLGNAVRAEVTSSGEIIFRESMDVVFGPNGILARDATEAALHSPDFGPAMQVVFGPSGELADAAHDAAQATNLDPAMQGLEDKVEHGVEDALTKAGTEAANKAGQTLGASVAAGATAMGNILTSVPQMYESVTKLGEVWDKPLNSTKAYMDLFAASGAVINQGVQVFQALAGVTQIATAAQAVFNAVMAMNPIVLIVLAVIALIAAIAALIIYWDQVKAALRDNPWLAVAAVMLGVIGIIIVIIAYWDEIKLAVLKAANFISIQVQRIGMFFAGLGTLIGQVWDWIVGTAANAGIAILNFFITVGTQVQNFFIGIVNGILKLYNEVAESAIGEFVGLEPAELIPEVAVETRLIPPKDVPEINVQAAFAQNGPVTGGLEGQIAAQEQVVAKAQQEDEARRQKQREEDAKKAQAAAPPAAPAGLPAVPGAPVGLPAGPAPAGLPAGAAAGVAGAAGGGMEVRVEGGITINLNAERLELDAAEVLTDEIVQRLRERLEALGSEAAFRTGARQAAPA